MDEREELQADLEEAYREWEKQQQEEQQQWEAQYGQRS